MFLCSSSYDMFLTHSASRHFPQRLVTMISTFFLIYSWRRASRLSCLYTLAPSVRKPYIVSWSFQHKKRYRAHQRQQNFPLHPRPVFLFLAAVSPAFFFFFPVPAAAGRFGPVPTSLADGFPAPPVLQAASAVWMTFLSISLSSA